ncbi:DUF6157 family protein [Microbacterium sp. zg.Y909]|uniref:DUF6157 family protein n=1 Tax=Microbacterium sp. zg.Y909 TaxID=2969413 RepID=UPI00214CA57A|nr:DUF6157 family protein [Microbacterium sp. zg.Y909]MCR2825190.1 DUF6157 family protein [Microbacterium sp. zg.Y909]
MTTNYRSTFITTAPDCPVAVAEVPPAGAKPSVASLQYELIHDHPYARTSDEILFEVHAVRAGISESERPAEWDRFFAKDQACLRASPLAKRYGWGFHHDEEGRVALVALGSAEYASFAERADLAQKPAMRSSRG